MFFSHLTKFVKQHRELVQMCGFVLSSRTLRPYSILGVPDSRYRDFCSPCSDERPEKLILISRISCEICSENVFLGFLDEHRKIRIERLAFSCTVVRVRTQFIPAPIYALAADDMIQSIGCTQNSEISETIWFQTAESSRANPREKVKQPTAAARDGNNLKDSIFVY